jgi:hypothetical protein
VLELVAKVFEPWPAVGFFEAMTEFHPGETIQLDSEITDGFLQNRLYAWQEAPITFILCNEGKNCLLPFL